MASDDSPHVRKVVFKGLTRFNKPKAVKSFEAMKKSESEYFVKGYATRLGFSK